MRFSRVVSVRRDLCSGLFDLYFLLLGRGYFGKWLFVCL